MLGPRVGPGEGVCLRLLQKLQREHDSKERGIAQGVLLWFQYYVRCLRYKVLMIMSAAFHHKIGKTIAYLLYIECIRLLMTMYKGADSRG